MKGVRMGVWKERGWVYGGKEDGCMEGRRMGAWREREREDCRMDKYRIVLLPSKLYCSLCRLKL